MIEGVDELDGEMVVTVGRNKTHKHCPRCSELKPVSEFYRSVYAYDGLQTYCKKCTQGYRLGASEKRYNGLYKRPFPLDGKCEICGKKFITYNYHHWNNSNPSLGIWVCEACDYFIEGIDEIDRNPWKVDMYRRLKKEVEVVEKAYVPSGRLLPPDGIHRLFLSNKPIYKWCSHCGKMLPISEFGKHRSNYDGLRTWCKKCTGGSMLGYGSKQTCGLHKRPKSEYCELCGWGRNLAYHHWDDSNKSKGVWVCNKNKCHNLAEVVDRLDSDSLLPGRYIELKQRVILEDTQNTRISNLETRVTQLEAENVLLGKSDVNII